MFRAEIQWLASGPTLKMEGKLVGEWAEEAMSLLIKKVVPQGLVVDLTAVTYIDCLGEEFLKWLGRAGSAFVPGNVYTSGVCEQLNLPILRDGSAPPSRRRGNAGERAKIKASS
jgi:hypothetical protein